MARWHLIIPVMALVATACGAAEPAGGPDWTPRPSNERGLAWFARTDGPELVIRTEGGNRDFVAGVNLGSTIPGTFPGEQAIDAHRFAEWFGQMSDFGFRAIRVYTIMPPSFYEQLERHNLTNPDSPLLLIHGVWIPQSELEAGDLFSPSVTEQFETELGRAVDVVHGDITIEDRPGHASGSYTADVSPWLMSWAIGIEWDPFVVEHTDQTNQSVQPVDGRYFQSTDDATPTEIWLAGMLERLAGLEAERGITMPLTFVNWPTTDPITHPDEPQPEEDLVGIDANHIRSTSRWPGGFYASYHAYPYYPDFQRHEDGIAGFEHNGQEDNYAGYLTKLRRHHAGIPVMINEFGVPSGMAHAHHGPQGRNQGGHSESEQMGIDRDLLEVIASTGMSGGIVFEWIDEWFKFTWNTIEYELPKERRALWTNPWNNESHFGILSADPGEAPVVTIDGSDDEWIDNGSQVILETRGLVREVRAVKDEGYLYLRLVTDQPELHRSQPIVIGLDVIAGGGGGLPDTGGLHPMADYAVTLDAEGGTISVRASNDPYGLRFALGEGWDPVADRTDFAEGSGIWNIQRLVVNRPHTIPSTGEFVETEVIEPGRMVFGSSDPQSPDFDSRTTWSARDHVIEIRLPYQAIGFSDPSSLRAYVISPDGAIATATVDRVGITIAVGGIAFETAGYAWEPWQTVTWNQRVKDGAAVFSTAVRSANGL